MARVDDIAGTTRLARPGQHVAIGLDGTRTAGSIVGGRIVVQDLPAVSPFDI